MSLARLRTLALKLPEAHEVEAWGEPTFRVKNKLFAMYAAPNNHHGACLLYTSDAADERSRVDLGGRRTIKKKKKK